MAIFLEGVRGSGKSKIAVAEIQTYLNNNRRVATNLDIDISGLSPKTESIITRLPDHPRAVDFEALGYAYPELNPDDSSSYDENKFGIIVVDELLTSFNSRSWNDPDRLAVVSWMVQSRKYGWRLWLISQDVDAVDKQLRETLLQEIWACRSGRNFFSSPILGKLLNLFINPIIKITAPLGFHICNVYTGKRKDKIHLAQTFFFKRYDLHPYYKTAQAFTKDIAFTPDGKTVDMRASYTLLPPKYLKNLANQQSQQTDLKPSFFQANRSLIYRSILLAGSILGAYYFMTSDEVTVPDPVQALQSVSDKSQLSSQTLQIEEPAFTMPKPDIPELYITCSVTPNRTLGNYCFEYQGKPFYPEQLGFQVQYIAPCRAGLMLDDQLYIVTCNPNYVHSEKAIFSDSYGATDGTT